MNQHGRLTERPNYDEAHNNYEYGVSQTLGKFQRLQMPCFYEYLGTSALREDSIEQITEGETIKFSTGLHYLFTSDLPKMSEQDDNHMTVELHVTYRPS